VIVCQAYSRVPHPRPVRVSEISTYLQTMQRFVSEYWWARQDSNLGPTDYESAALTAELRARTFVTV
jgi:hypothetical protein